MRTGALIAGYFAVAVAFFLLGRFTAGPIAPGAAPVEPARAEAPKPPSPPPAPAAPASAFRVDDLRVGGAAPKAAPEVFPVAPGPADSVAIPPGTAPAKDASPSDGPKNAAVIVLEVSDFQCPVCKRAYEPLRQLAADFPGKVRLVFKQHPLEMHRNAMNAAAASMAAARQGKFQAMADLLFANQGALSESDLNSYAARIGLDMTRYQKDYRDVSLRAKAKAEGEAAMGLGATGTPSFFVNGRKQVGWASYESVKQEVTNEIRAVEGLVAGGKTLKEARIERVRANLPNEAEKLLASPLGTEFSEP
jgi:protein-disulfide isomerase